MTDRTTNLFHNVKGESRWRNKTLSEEGCVGWGGGG